MKSVFGISLILVTIFFGMALAMGSDVSLEDQYEKIIGEIEAKKKRHKDLQKKEKSLLDDLDRLAFMLDRKGGQLRSLERDLSKTKKAISKQENEMSRLRHQMSGTQKQIQARVAALYKISKVGPWAFFLSAEKYSDSLRMFKFLSTMIDYDVGLLTTFGDQLRRQEALQRELAASQSRLLERRKDVRGKAQEVKTLRLRQKRDLSKLRSAKTSFAKVIQDLEKQAERLQSLIEALPSQNRTPSQGLSGFRALKGRLPLPVEGRIDKSSQRGIRGISFKASEGAIARAVYRGRVVYAGWFKGYGKILIIDHGDRFHTVMGHASELLKKKNDWVETGESVARVGSTGSLGGPSLYFEIRQDGRPMNPLDWFSKLAKLPLR
jgi:septal ring factor EnvC (AmiA/AmiB activator)